MNSQYETLYGVGLLDDLHNYFPAILYNPRAFRSVSDLLVYVQDQTRDRFDLFSLGQREWRSRRSPDVEEAVVPPPPPPVAVNPPVEQVVGRVSSVINVASNDLSGNSVSPNSTLPPPIRRTLGGFLAGSPLGTSLQYTLNLPEQDDEEEETALTTHLLAALLNVPLRRQLNIPGPARGLDAFLQPVVVRPTPEQINANTTVGNLVSDTEHTCAICQDSLQSDQEGRKLNACGHWFHKNCIDTWFEGNVHCPVCRHDIREPLPSTEDTTG